MAGGIAVGRLFKCTSDHGLSGKVLHNRCVCFRIGVFSFLYITNVFKGEYGMKYKKIFLGILIIILGGGIYFFSEENDRISNNDIKFETTHFTEKTSDNSYIRIVDDYVDDAALNNLYNEENLIKRLKRFNENLTDHFDYYEISFQALQSLDYYDGDERFVKIYNRRGGKIINQEINIDGKRCYVTSFNTLQTNERFFSENLNFVDEGEGFEKKDYLLSASEKVPIILGHNYKKDVNLGETFTLNYLEKNLEFYVKGFFEEGLCIKSNNMVTCLDNYICMPSFACTEMYGTERENFMFCVRHYLQKNQGYIKYTDSYELADIEKKLIHYIDDSMLKYSRMETTFQIDVYKDGS